MTKLFRHNARLMVWPSNVATYKQPEVEALQIDDLRMTFSITKQLAKEPNDCEITVTNASQATRGLLTRKPVRAQLLAGYGDELRHLFLGDLRFASTKREPPERITTLLLGDGDRAYRHARVRKSYKRGTAVKTALTDCAAAMGLLLPTDAKISSELSEQFASGAVLAGAARDELTSLLAPYGYGWSIQDGRLQIVKDGDTSRDAERLISQATGLIGSPEWGAPDKSGKKPPTLTCTTLLYPEITPGGRIRLESDSESGIFRVERVVHTGDTHGDTWTSEIELKPL